MAREVNRLKGEDMTAANAMASHLRKISGVLGLLEQEPDVFLQSGAQADDGEVAEIEALIQQRLDARKAKDWAAADAARDRLAEMGIILEDGPQAPPGGVSKRFYRPLYLHRTACFLFFRTGRKINTHRLPQILMFTPGHCPAVMGNKADDAVAAV